MDASDLEAAVRAGVVPGELADQLRNFSAQRRGVPGADEERFGLVGGLSDIMTAVGLFLLLGAATAPLVVVPFGPAVMVPVTWYLARHFTVRRRLTLASFVLFGLFALTSAFTLVGCASLLGGAGTMVPKGPLGATQTLVVATGTAWACIAWWYRFRLPVAIAAATVAGVNALTHLLRLVMPEAPTGLVSLYLLLVGVAMFVMAMRWDMTDIRRETRRSDIAFWLHAAAGYQIAGASFRLIFGVEGSPSGWERLYHFTIQPPEPAGATLALLVFLLFCAVALAVDRRSLLMSSLAFAVPAAAGLTHLDGPGGLIVGAMLIGSLLVGLSSAWTRLRAMIMDQLPPLVRAQLPRAALVQRGPRPVL